MNSVLIALNIMKRLLKEVNAFMFLFIFPIIAAVIAVALFAKPQTVKLGAANIPSKDFGIINYLSSTGKYKIETADMNTIKASVKNGKYDIGIVFPDELPSPDGNTIKLITKKSDNNAKMLMGEMEVYLGNAFSGKQQPKIDGESISNDKYQQSRAAVGILTMFILMFSGSGIGLLIEDKHKKTFMRNFCAPLKGYEMMTGQLLANAVLGILQIIIFLLVSSFIFNMDWGTSVLNVFLLLVMFLITSIGFSIGLGGFVEDAQKYSVIISITSTITSTIGGAFFPVESAGKIIAEVSKLLPQKWVLDAFTKLEAGSSISGVGTQLMVLALFGVVFFTFGIKTLKPSLNDL